MCYPVPANNSSHLSSAHSARYAPNTSLSPVILRRELGGAGGTHFVDGETKALRDGVICLNPQGQWELKANFALSSESQALRF